MVTLRFGEESHFDYFNTRLYYIFHNARRNVNRCKDETILAVDDETFETGRQEMSFHGTEL